MRRKTLDLVQTGGQINAELSIRGQVVKVTKAHEIIDVNGFTIKRRKTEVGGPRGKADLVVAEQLKTPYEQDKTSCASQRTPNVEEFEITEELYDRLNRSLRNLPEVASPAERLAAICMSICDAEAALLSKQSHDLNKGAVDTVFSTFLLSLEREMQQGLICFAETSSEENALLDYEDLRVDIEARKLGLRSRLQALRSEKDEWQSLLAKFDEMKTSPIPSEDATESELPSTGVTLYAAEELDALQRMEGEVLQRLTMQVDGVCTLLGNVEDLLLRANDVAQEAQRHQHSRRFKAFHHMNSPARLIKAIVQAPVSGFE